ncbi:MAG: hypothetical protein P1U58_09620 [Verrucomicrobiales bacterium]|nr:hypothetical protein [Verrucomicrobiales bacterium]
MIKFLPVFIATALVTFSINPAQAGGTGYYSGRTGSTSCATSKFQTPRYNQLLPYRHYEDRRRYNAAPCSNQAKREHPYLLKTVVVNRKKVPHYTYDGKGRRFCRQVVMVTYKDLFSDGSCRVWTQKG